MNDFTLRTPDRRTVVKSGTGVSRQRGCWDTEDWQSCRADQNRNITAALRWS